MKFLLLIFAVLLGVIDIGAQANEKDYSPLRDFNAPEEIIQKLQERFSTWSAKKPIDNKKVRQAFDNFAKQRAAYFGALDSMDVLMHTDPISVFLNQIAAQLVAANPELTSASYYVFTQRSMEPNAYSLGEGIIFVSLGLLDRIETVDQLAFVIAHEMGHDHLAHGYTDGLRFCENYFDPKFQQSLSRIKRKQAGRNTKIKNLMNSFRASHMRHSRRNEMEADSFGLMTSVRAGYSDSSGMQVMTILDRADEFRYTDTIVLQSFFDFPEYPFKPRWVNTDNTMLNWEADPSLYRTPDSLKSHPDCALRIAAIQRMIQSIPHATATPGDLDAELHAAHEKVPFELLESIIYSNDYVLALYFSLHMQREYPDNLYLKCVTAHSLYELAGALMRNEFLEYVEFPDHAYSAGYNHLLAFLHNMNSSTLNQLFLRYKELHFNNADNHPYVAYLNVIEDRVVSQVELESYASISSDSYFIQLLTNSVQKP
jgi:Zn-dependent protease with chaperone function